MKMKLFNLRLTPQNAPHDQDAINHFMGQVDVKKTATQYVPDTPDFWSVLVFYDDLQVKAKDAALITEADLTEEEKYIYAALRLWRKDRATEIDLPEFMIFQNYVLATIAREKPKDLVALMNIKGCGDKKVAKYGDDITAIIRAF